LSAVIHRLIVSTARWDTHTYIHKSSKLEPHLELGEDSRRKPVRAICMRLTVCSSYSALFAVARTISGTRPPPLPSRYSSVGCTHMSSVSTTASLSLSVHVNISQCITVQLPTIAHHTTPPPPHHTTHPALPARGKVFEPTDCRECGGEFLEKGESGIGLRLFFFGKLLEDLPS
jgi:hypothetical protein